MMSLSISRWMCLLTVMTVMLSFREYSVDAYRVSCCTKTRYRVKWPVQQCVKQIRRVGCVSHAYMVRTWKGWTCINPHSQWLRWQLKKGIFRCRRSRYGF